MTKRRRKRPPSLELPGALAIFAAGAAVMYGMISSAFAVCGMLCDAPNPPEVQTAAQVAAALSFLAAALLACGVTALLLHQRAVLFLLPAGYAALLLVLWVPAFVAHRVLGDLVGLLALSIIPATMLVLSLSPDSRAYYGAGAPAFPDHVEPGDAG